MADSKNNRYLAGSGCLVPTPQDAIKKEPHANLLIRRTPEQMKSCLKELWHTGIGDPTSDENRKIVAWFVLEFHRMGYADEDVLAEVLDWADHTYPNLNQSRVNSLSRLVTRILRNPHELGCPSDDPDKPYRGSLSDICFRSERPCEYHAEFKRIKEALRALPVDEAAYDRFDWLEELMRHSKSSGYYADAIYRTFRTLERERGIPPGETITVGYRDLAGRIHFKKNMPRPHLMSLVRATRVLEEVGLITIPIRGKPRGADAKSKPQANGYRRVIPIPAPDSHVVLSEEMARLLHIHRDSKEGPPKR